MLEISKRNLDAQTVRVFDDEFEVYNFVNLTAEDITGNGRIKPLAAQHFAERANQIQNVTNFFQTLIQTDPDIKMHFSSVKLAKMAEELLDLERQDLMEPFIRITESAQAQRMEREAQVQLQKEAQMGAEKDSPLPEDIGMTGEEGFEADEGNPNALGGAPAGPQGEGGIPPAIA
jgi:hypothetical protein